MFAIANFSRLIMACSPEKGFRHLRPFSTPLMAVEPIVDHRMSQRFRLFAVASYDFPGAFNITG
jgi:hypothetical protein